MKLNTKLVQTICTNQNFHIYQPSKVLLQGKKTEKSALRPLFAALKAAVGVISLGLLKACTR